jgi:hypothetical protein
VAVPGYSLSRIRAEPLVLWPKMFTELGAVWLKPHQIPFPEESKVSARNDVQVNERRAVKQGSLSVARTYVASCSENCLMEA